METIQFTHLPFRLTLTICNSATIKVTVVFHYKATVKKRSKASINGTDEIGSRDLNQKQFANFSSISLIKIISRAANIIESSELKHSKWKNQIKVLVSFAFHLNISCKSKLNKPIADCKF